MQTATRNVLIVSASIGSGHTQAAQAVADELGRCCPHIRVRVIDFMGEENSYLGILLKETYLKMLHISPNMYDWLYRWSHMPVQGSKVQNLLARLLKKNMLRLIRCYQPDLIITTHPFPCGAAAHLKSIGKTGIPLAAVITDFSVHRLWVYRQVDDYCVPNEETRLELVRQGIRPERIHITGIPLRADFAKPAGGSAIAVELGLDLRQPVVLIMGGGLGLGGMGKAFFELNKIKLPLQLIVVAGQNAELRDSLQRIGEESEHMVKVLGFSDRIRELMDIAAVLITKPGALTVSEGMARGLPMLLYDSIPGQEMDNAAYLARQGAAFWVQQGEHLGDAVTGLLTNPALRSAIGARAGELGRPHSAAEVVRVLDLHLLHRNRSAK
ncbi:MAG: glycosyltransferase [Veillonellales bacterium]